MDGFITMSNNVLNDLKSFTDKKAIKIEHPLYDNFGEALSKDEARKFLNIPVNGDIILFFGFIRKYKGLDLLLEAMKILKDQKAITPSSILPILLIAGEFYDDELQYKKIIQKLDIADQLDLRTHFIDDQEVKYYLSAADFVIQPYKNATQSGVTPLAYHFEKPMLVTNVGGLADMVPDSIAGVVVEPNAKAIADGIQKLYQLGENYYLPQLRLEKEKYSWVHLTDAILELANLQKR
jgi:glycosyltransferase involved in cell wall biosynthesis